MINPTRLLHRIQNCDSPIIQSSLDIMSANDGGKKNSPERDMQEEEDLDEIELEEDIYGMIYVEGWGIPFLYSSCAACMQLIIVVLFFVDIKGNSPENRLNLPLAIDLNVRLTQFLALPLCVMSHEGK